MKTDPEQRPSRRGWPLRTQDTTTPAGTHAHDLPVWLRWAGIGFAVTLLLILAMFSLLMVYIADRGAQRDREYERTQEQIRTSLCDLMDQLPEGELLERPRAKYGCGPGIPLEDLPADIRDRYQGRGSDGASALPTPTVGPPLGAPAVPNPPRGPRFYTPAPTGENP